MKQENKSSDELQALTVLGGKVKLTMKIRWET